MKKRIISIMVMLSIVVPLLLLGGIYSTLLMLFLGVASLYELFKVIGSKHELPLILKLIGYLIVGFMILYDNSSGKMIYTIDFRIMSLIIFAYLIPLVFINNNDKYSFQDAFLMISSVVFVGLTFNLAIVLRNMDLSYLIYLVLISTITDTFAYITGRLVGRHKVAPLISPNKTIEGCIGGFVMGTLIGTVYFMEAINVDSKLLIIVLVSALLSIVGQIGDLVFSSIKRYYKIKDFSNLIPGHGGILDRLDSIIFIILAFILVLPYL